MVVGRRPAAGEVEEGASDVGDAVDEVFTAGAVAFLDSTMALGGHPR